MTAAEILRDARELLGPNGEHWNSRGWGSDHRHCAVEALHRATARQTVNPWNSECQKRFEDVINLFAAELEIKTSPFRIGEWNDDDRTSFEDVALVLKRALHRAEEAGL